MTRDIEQRGLYYEELELDIRYVHRPGRTMTEADNVLFSTLTMNPQALHLDAAWSAEQPFGQRLVNSMMTLAVLVGELGRAADPGHDRREPRVHRRPVPAPAVPRGHAVLVDGRARRSGSRRRGPGQGVVTLEHTGRNQDDVVVATATRDVLFWCRP